MTGEEKNIPEDAQSFRVPEDEPANIEPPQRPGVGVQLSEEERRAQARQFQELAAACESEKEKQWYKIRAEVEKIVDGIGRGIDEGIKDDVATFMALEFPTSASCDGHGVAGPWIEVYAPAPDGWQESEEKQKQWTEANHAEKVNMQELVDEFYAHRNVPESVRLILDPMGAFEAFRVQSAGYQELWEQLKKEDADQAQAAQFKKEMEDFTEYLKQKYFAE